MIKIKDGYEICLDGRVLKTPNGVPLKIPTNRTTFAHLVAGEWESQEKVLKTHALPLVRSQNEKVFVIAIDKSSSSCHRRPEFRRGPHRASIASFQVFGY